MTRLAALLLPPALAFAALLTPTAPAGTPTSTRAVMTVLPPRATPTPGETKPILTPGPTLSKPTPAGTPAAERKKYRLYLPWVEMP